MREMDGCVWLTFCRSWHCTTVPKVPASADGRRPKAIGQSWLARERQDPPGAGAGWKAAWVVTFAQLFVHLICSRQSRQAALEAQTRGAGVQREKKAALRAQRAPDTAIYDAQRSSSRSFLTHR